MRARPGIHSWGLNKGALPRLPAPPRFRVEHMEAQLQQLEDRGRDRAVALRAILRGAPCARCCLLLPPPGCTPRAAVSLLPACCPPRTPGRRCPAATQLPPRTPVHPPTHPTHPHTDDQQVDQLLSQDDGQLEAGAAEKEEPWDSYRNRCGGALPQTPASGPDLHAVHCCCCCCLRTALRRISHISPAPVPCPPPSTHPSFTLLLSKGYLRTVETVRNRLMVSEWELGQRPIALQL